jgi:hypothetical protein
MPTSPVTSVFTASEAVHRKGRGNSEQGTADKRCASTPSRKSRGIVSAGGIGFLVF